MPIVEQNQDPAPQFGAVRKPVGAARDAMVAVTATLQDYFLNDPDVKAAGYWFSGNPKDTRIVIRTMFDEFPAFYPQIIVDLGSLNFTLRGFGGNEGQIEDRGEVYEQIGGRSEGNIVIRVECERQGTQLDLTDLVTFCIMEHWKTLTAYGIITAGTFTFGDAVARPNQQEPARSILLASLNLPFAYNWFKASRQVSPIIEGFTADAEPVADIPILDPDRFYNQGTD